MNSPAVGTRIAIIGAGLAGISAARDIRDRGAEVTVFEKSRGHGGRCASKRWEGHVVDHGAQYFTIRDERFRAAVTAACGDRVMRLTAPILTGEETNEPPEATRWFHREGNSRLVRDLAQGLDVRLETPIDDARALLRSEGGDYDQVISTAPWPQTARLFGLAADSAVDYVPCLAVLLAYRTDPRGRAAEVYAFRERDGRASSPLAWTACENHKPGRIAPGVTVIVSHLSEAFSREHLERPPEEYPALVRGLVEDRWELPSATFTAGLGHRWRLARVDQAMAVPELNLPPGLHFAGDALRASRVEDAWLAGAAWAPHNFANMV